jgi:hypothetical protein
VSLRHDLLIPFNKAVNRKEQLEKVLKRRKTKTNKIKRSPEKA